MKQTKKPIRPTYSKEPHHVHQPPPFHPQPQFWQWLENKRLGGRLAPSDNYYADKSKTFPLSSLGYAVLMTTHNPDHCFMLGGDVGIIYPNGNFIKGACDTMLTEKSLEEIYNTPFTITTIPEVQRKTCIPHL